MFLDISSENFKRVFEQDIFHLPQRWDGKDFLAAVRYLFYNYREALKTVVGKQKYDNQFGSIDNLCDKIILSIEKHLKGYHSRAFNPLEDAMKILMKNPIKAYSINHDYEFFEHNENPLNLFRVRNVEEDVNYSRSDIFHLPYNLRSKAAACRYSIAGHPSLYLGTSLDLCKEELQINSSDEFQIASRFELVKNQNNGNTSIRVIELALKPQDFFKMGNDENSDDERSGRYFKGINFRDDKNLSAYVSWYPLIAACSYIRLSKKDPFAPEYIIPQLLMQWVRHKCKQNKLYGIRYFSCASPKASEMGFNFVFPVSGNKHRKSSEHCDVLTESFKLTVPKYIDELQECKIFENALIRDKELDFIFCNYSVTP